MNTTELHRRLENLLTFGTVADVDAASGKMRLTIGGNTTDWVPIAASAAGRSSAWRCPTVGEQYLIACPSGDLGNATPIMCVYSTANPAPSLDPDLSVYQFGAVRIEINEITGHIAVTASDLTLSITSITATGTLLVNGLIKSMNDVVAKTISLFMHKHPGVQSGGASTGQPQ